MQTHELGYRQAFSGSSNVLFPHNGFLLPIYKQAQLQGLSDDSRRRWGFYAALEGEWGHYSILPLHCVCRAETFVKSGLYDIVYALHGGPLAHHHTHINACMTF